MVPLQAKLRDVIGQLSLTVRTSKLISINAALAAGRGSSVRAEDSAAFRTVAQEIQRLSEQSELGIGELHTVLEAVRVLSQTINLAGRQRMLSQKVMKTHLIARELRQEEFSREEQGVVAEFEAAHARLVASPLNTPEILAGLRETDEVWRRFCAALRRGDLEGAIASNEELLESLHRTVLAYEALAG